MRDLRFGNEYIQFLIVVRTTPYGYRTTSHLVSSPQPVSQSQSVSPSVRPKARLYQHIYRLCRFTPGVYYFFSIGWGGGGGGGGGGGDNICKTDTYSVLPLTTALFHFLREAGRF